MMKINNIDELRSMARGCVGTTAATRLNAAADELAVLREQMQRIAAQSTEHFAVAIASAALASAGAGRNRGER